MTILLLSAASASDSATVTRTPIRAAPGSIVEVVARGLADQRTELRVRLVNADGDTVVADAVPIRETDLDDNPDLADYTARLTVPTDLGSYRVVWVDPDGVEVDEPLIIDGWRPSIADVAALLRARTRDSDGNELGTFTDDGETRPTAADVQTLIDHAVADVEGNIVGVLPARMYVTARMLAALGAALLVEGSYFAEQADDSSDSMTGMYRDMYTAGLLRLRETTRSNVYGGGIGSLQITSSVKTAIDDDPHSYCDELLP